MKVTSRSRMQLRVQNITFVLLFLAVMGVLAWLSTRYHYQTDWTFGGRNTLSEASVGVVKRLAEPLKITVFSADSGVLKDSVQDLVGRYQRHKKDIELLFVNPDTDPELVRQLGIRMDGEMLLEYGGRSEQIVELNEQVITNALQRLTRSGERWLVFVEGHGERSPFKQANHDIQIWAQQLEQKGFKLQGLNLATEGRIPDNAAMLIIASPQVAFLPGEVALIEAYVRKGGNILWLLEPDGMMGLDAIAEQLGLELEPGVIVDPSTQMFAIDNPTFAIVGDYGFHALTQDFNMLTIYPMAAGLDVEEQDNWQSQAFLTTTANSWIETGVLKGEIGFDEGEDTAGPLSIGIALTRQLQPAGRDGEEEEDGFDEAGTAVAENSQEVQQRVVVVGDGDFLSNAYLGNGGNLNMGLNMVNWLSSDDQLLSIPAKTARDVSLNLSQTQLTVIGFYVLAVMPLLLAGSGLTIWLRRRKA